LIGYALPRHPQALFVAVGDNEAVIARGDRLAAGAIPASPAVASTAIAVHLVRERTLAPNS